MNTEIYGMLAADIDLIDILIKHIQNEDNKTNINKQVKIYRSTSKMCGMCINILLLSDTGNMKVNYIYWFLFV